VPKQAQQEVTQLLQAWRGGERAALDRLVPLVQAELHRLAHIYMTRERPGHTLQTSALVNEAYLRLIDIKKVDWQDRAHFFAISANVMRRVLMQYARLRGAGKRGGGEAVRVELDEAFVPSPERDADLIALDGALNLLEETDPREAKVVELRFFGGLNEEETAQVLGVSDRTVRREWEHAKAWLIHQLKRGVSA
jgi:RNA polymerase sigma factor (TIGR02999 family)